MRIYICTMHLLFHEKFQKNCVKTKMHKNKIANDYWLFMSIFTYLHNVDISMNVSCKCPHSEDNFGTTQCWIGSDVHSADQYKRENIFQIVLVKNLDINYHCILLPKLFWPTVRKNCSSDQEKLLKFEAEGREFAKILRSLEKFIQTVKGQNNFW